MGRCGLQVMFVEVTDMMLRKSLSMAKSAKRYDSWKQNQVPLTPCLNCIT
jgi:hypothetical protein